MVESNYIHMSKQLLIKKSTMSNSVINI